MPRYLIWIIALALLPFALKVALWLTVCLAAATAGFSYGACLYPVEALWTAGGLLALFGFLGLLQHNRHPRRTPHYNPWRAL